MKKLTSAVLGPRRKIVILKSWTVWGKIISLATRCSFFISCIFVYRIYSRISREILDNFCNIFFQFDLYAGHKNVGPKLHENRFPHVLKSLVYKYRVLKNRNFGHILDKKSSIRPIRGSTYTRVYTVIKCCLKSP